MQRNDVRTGLVLLLLLGALGNVACAGDDTPSDDDGLVRFEGAGAPAGVGGAGSGAPSGVAGSPSGPAPVTAVGGSSSGNEGNVTPTGLEPVGAGGSASVGAGSSGAADASLGGSASTSTGGAAGSGDVQAGVGGAGMGVGGAGMGDANEPPPPEPAGSCPASALFCDDFEDDATGQFPGAPWQDNTGSGATVRVDGVQAFSGTKAVHVNAPPNQGYRRGYFSLEQGSSNVFPAVSRTMFGRAMMFLDATPNAVAHWTILQAEGRAANGTHDAYYRYGGQQQGGAGLMANYETNSGVSTDCYSHSATRMPVQRWACVEWHFDAGRNEMQLWLDGNELTDMHVVDRPTTAGSGCLGNDVNGQWLAPPAFTTLHLGWESYQASTNDRNLWVDDVAIGTERLGCPAP